MSAAASISGGAACGEGPCPCSKVSNGAILLGPAKRNQIAKPPITDLLRVWPHSWPAQRTKPVFLEASKRLRPRSAAEAVGPAWPSVSPVRRIDHRTSGSRARPWSPLACQISRGGGPHTVGGHSSLSQDIAATFRAAMRGAPQALLACPRTCSRDPENVTHNLHWACSPSLDHRSAVSMTSRPSRPRGATRMCRSCVSPPFCESERKDVAVINFRSRAAEHIERRHKATFAALTIGNHLQFPRPRRRLQERAVSAAQRIRVCRCGKWKTTNSSEGWCPVEAECLENAAFFLRAPLAFAPAAF